MELPGSRIMPKRPKKACTECRQQKARCDAYLDPGSPCSRCRRMSVRCVISDPFQRQNKRRKLSELQHETAELRQQLRSSSQLGISPPPITTLTTVPGQFTTEEVNPTLPHMDARERSPRPLPSSIGVLETFESLPCDKPTRPTLPRTLERLDMDSTDIDELFRTYFRDYAPFMPLLDPSLTPNDYHTLCPLMFWAVAAVASRTSSRNPTLLEVLSPRVHNLALLSLGKHATLHTVQALLLLLQWPSPKTHVSADLNWPLCGAVLHMAMQIGLHLPLSSQEFSKVRLTLSQAEVNKRAQTWAYCILVYQELCLGKGTPPILFRDVSHDREQRRALLQKIDPCLKFEVKIQDIIAKFCRAVSNHGLRILSVEQERSLSVLIQTFRSQIDGVKLQSLSDLNHLSHSLARLVIASFYLYRTPSTLDPESVIAICSPACELLEVMDSLDRRGEIAIAAAPVIYLYGLIMSCQILIRLVKTSFSQYIDVERVKSAFYTGLNLSKRMSVVNNDMFSRYAEVATQLWNSSKAFKGPDGTELTALRIRGRLAMSPVLDGMAWWREEHGGFQGVYPPWMNETANASARTDADLLAEASTSALPAESQDLSHYLSDPFFAELGWTLDETLSLSTWMTDTESSSMGWVSTMDGLTPPFV